MGEPAYSRPQKLLIYWKKRSGSVESFPINYLLGSLQDPSLSLLICIFLSPQLSPMDHMQLVLAITWGFLYLIVFRRILWEWAWCFEELTCSYFSKMHLARQRAPNDSTELQQLEALQKLSLTCDQHLRYLDTALRDVLFTMSSSSLQGTLESNSCTRAGVMLANPENLSGSTELLKAQTKHFPSRRVTRIQTTGAIIARCRMAEQMNLCIGQWRIYWSGIG